MSRIEVVTGGARSGKSSFAERRTVALARNDERPVAYIATATVTDEEMRERIAHHQARRPGSWRTIEAPDDLAAAIADGARDGGVVLVDCLAVWSGGHLMEVGDPDQDADTPRSEWRASVARLEHRLVAQLDAGLDAATATGADVILVTNEVGLGVVPATPLGRIYRDLLGRLNQHAAARADAVHLVIAGIAVDLRAIGHALSNLEG